MRHKIMWVGVSILGINWFLYHFTPVLDFIPAIEFLKIQVLGAVLSLGGIYLNYNYGEKLKNILIGAKSE